jgi:hypothetical protein
MASVSERTVESVLNDAAQTLATAEFGLADLTGADPRRRMPGLRNVVVFGRAVTNILQNLRSVVGRQDFDEWYVPWQQRMAADELLKYFYNLRTEILKKGNLQAVNSAEIKLTGLDMREMMRSPPPGAIRFFIGDELNGNGWMVTLPDGSVEKYYVALPPQIQSRVIQRFLFPDAPQSHAGQQVEDTSVENLAKLYVEYLQNLLAEARKQFGGAGL